MLFTMGMFGMMETGSFTQSRLGFRRKTARRPVRMASSTSRRSLKGRRSCTEHVLHARPSPPWRPVSMWSSRSSRREDVALIYLQSIFPILWIALYLSFTYAHSILFPSNLLINQFLLYNFIQLCYDSLYTDVVAALQITYSRLKMTPEESIQ